MAIGDVRTLGAVSDDTEKCSWAIPYDTKCGHTACGEEAILQAGGASCNEERQHDLPWQNFLLVEILRPQRDPPMFSAELR